MAANCKKCGEEPNRSVKQGAMAIGFKNLFLYLQNEKRQITHNTSFCYFDANIYFPCSIM